MKNDRLIEVIEASNKLMEKNNQVLEQLSTTLEVLLRATVDNRNMLIYLSSKMNEKR